MTQTELDQLRAGDVLKIQRPKSPAAAAQRTRIESIYSPCPGVRVAHCTYHQVIEGRVYPNRLSLPEDCSNDCELNTNLFGGEELVREGL